MTLVQLILGFLVLGAGHNNRLVFQTNQGQAPADVRYILETPEYLLHFKRGEMVFHFANNAIRIQFAGPLIARVPAGNARVDRVVRYINSDGNQGKPAPAFSSVRYEPLYSGIDLSCFGHLGRLQCDFVTMPGADPGLVRIDIEGADRIAIDEGGNLAIEVMGQMLHIHKPSGVQVSHGQRNAVDVQYQITGNNEIGFTIGPYDHRIPLIIESH